eukprot:TRINITY_DN82365_c0_g1_i1.p1 TRINITY_DN82365_c0_g1~~TRINITY_DN82365_c0_g1_i1.p1  ORF type:complete len:789 (-),score=147.40 TRINITY_DN82365_c0_g1_i1:144-2510(-)
MAGLQRGGGIRPDTPGRVLLKVTVEIKGDESDTIEVRANDSAEDLAERFCAKHGLPETLIVPLANHINENVRTALAAGAIANQRDEGRLNVTTEAAGGAQVQRRRSQSAAPSNRGHEPAATPVRRPGRSVLTSRSCTTEGPTEAARTASVLTTRATASTPRGPGHDDIAGLASAHLDEREQNARLAAIMGRQTSGGATSSRSTPRFERLHQDAVQRKFRLDRLRQLVERDLEDQQARESMQSAPGTIAGYSAMMPRREAEPLGDRLYRDAAQRERKMQRMREQQDEVKKRQEEVWTFRPDISSSQVQCQGVGQAMRDPEGKRMKKKLENMRQMKERCALDKCTFKPEIDQRSEALVNRRLSQMKVHGSLHDALYEDALRRQERQCQLARQLPPGVTFQPDIGVEKDRPPNDDTKEDFVNRLAYSKNHSERWLQLQQQQEQADIGISQDSNRQPFHPQTGRGPLKERNADGLPVWDHLHKMAQTKAAKSQVSNDQEEDRERSLSQRRKMGGISAQLFEDSKRRKYADIWKVLTSSDPSGKLCPATVTTERLEDDMVDFLKPLLGYLHEKNECLEFDAFCCALDFQRQHSAVPTGHLFVEKASTRTSARYRSEIEGEAFTPRTDERSNRLAARRRPRGTPLHDQLMHEKEVWQCRLQEQRVRHEQEQLSECTFQPASNSSRISSRRRPRSCDPQSSRGGAPTSAVMAIMGRGSRAAFTPSPRSCRSDSCPPASDPGAFRRCSVACTSEGAPSGYDSWMDQALPLAAQGVSECRQLLSSSILMPPPPLLHS